MTPEQERAEARKALEQAERWHAGSVFKAHLRNSLDREKQLIAENKQLTILSEAVTKQINSHIELVDYLNGKVAEQDKEIQRLRKVEEDYKALQEIMERARRLAFLAQEEEEPRTRFKMDANGNLTRVE